MDYLIIDHKVIDPSYNGKEYACLQCFDGFRKIKLVGDGQGIANMNIFDYVSFNYVYEDGTLDPVVRKCQRHELYGIKK